MGNLFGKKTKSRVTDHDKAVLQVKQQRDKVKQFQSRIEKNLELERNLTKELIIAGQRQKAKLLLRKKWFQEKLLEKTDKQLEALEKLISDLEFSQIELEVVKGLKVGNEALKKVNELLNIDEIERILEETHEGIEKQKEINDLLSGELTDEDEEAVEEEFNNLMQMDAEKEKDEEINLPEVPNENPERRKEAVKESKKRAVALEAS